MTDPYPKPAPRKPRRPAPGSTLAGATKPIAPFSKKRGEFYRTSGYAVKRDAAKGSPCQIVSPVCTGRAEHLHEPLSRGRAGGLAASLRDGPEPLPSCDACNSYVSQNPVWARERGLLLSMKDVRP